MAYSFSVNNTPGTGPIAIYQLVTALIAAGWTKVADSDGTTYSSSGVQVTSGAAGAGGLANVNAWVRLKAPAVNGGTIVNQQREFTFQRAASGVAATDDRAWRVKYSASAGFTGGSPGATQTPSATDEVFMVGGGTDASPTFLASWLLANGTYRWHIGCGGAAEFYSFYAVSLTTGSTTAGPGCLMDVMATGSFPVTDVDPAVLFFSAPATAFGAASVFSGTGAVIANTTNPALARAWLGAVSAAGAATTLTNSQNVNMYGMGAASGIMFGNGANTGTNPFTSKDDLVPAWWGRIASSVAPVGLKGCSTLCLYGSIVRTGMDTADTVSVGSKDKVFITGANMWLPWSGATPTI